MLKYLTLLLLSAYAYGSETDMSLKYMVNAGGGGIVGTRGLSLAVSAPVHMFRYKFEGGLWADGREGASNSGFGSASMGVLVDNTVYASFYQGAGIITSPDRYLGGPIQFFMDASVGLQDKANKTRLGVFYKHISSAGIYSPNLGRDYFGLEIGIGL